jgi:hypothetical protein
MAKRHKSVGTREKPTEQAVRDEEVRRASRELAAYFKGRRTEREARGALKIIKAFVRDREHRNPKTLAPLPGLAPTKTPKKRAKRVRKSAASEPPPTSPES